VYPDISDALKRGGVFRDFRGPKKGNYPEISEALKKSRLRCYQHRRRQTGHEADQQQPHCEGKERICQAMTDQEANAFIEKEVCRTAHRAYQDGKAGVTKGYPWSLSSDLAEHYRGSEMDRPIVMNILKAWYGLVNSEYERGRREVCETA